VSWLWMLPSVVISSLLVAGLGGALLGSEPGQSWGLFIGGIFLAMASAFGLAAAGAVASARGAAWRSTAVRAAAFPMLVMLVAIVPNLGRLNPVIHDVTTDPADTLQFPPDVASRADEPAREDVLEAQREGYPDLAPLMVPETPAESFARAQRVAASLPGWQVVEADPASGMLRATATSRVFRFVDDVVIRVQPEGTGSRIDMRSRSRMGAGDLGANAARVRLFQETYLEGEG
jgi:uncharacterized protein (DUF1499 family)